MKWDPRRRVYLHPDGSVVTPKELRNRIEVYISENKEDVGSEAKKLLGGSVSAVSFFAWLRDKIASAHGSAAIVAYGGEDEMNTERWARVGDRVASEIAYAEAFESQFIESEAVAETIIAEARALGVDGDKAARIVRTTYPASDIPRVLDLPEDVFGARLGTLIFGQTEARSTMYMDAIYGTYENSVKAREGDAGVVSGRRVCEEDQASCQGCIDAATEDYLPLEEILDIGDAECMSACRCTIEFDYAGVGPLEIDREVLV